MRGAEYIPSPAPSFPLKTSLSAFTADEAKGARHIENETGTVWPSAGRKRARLRKLKEYQMLRLAMPFLLVPLITGGTAAAILVAVG